MIYTVTLSSQILGRSYIDDDPFRAILPFQRDSGVSLKVDTDTCLVTSFSFVHSRSPHLLHLLSQSPLAPP